MSTWRFPNSWISHCRTSNRASVRFTQGQRDNVGPAWSERLAPRSPKQKAYGNEGEQNGQRDDVCIFDAGFDSAAGDRRDGVPPLQTRTHIANTRRWPNVGSTTCASWDKLLCKAKGQHIAVTFTLITECFEWDAPPVFLNHFWNTQCNVNQNKCMCFNPLTAKLFNLNFHPLEVVSRWRDPQLQVSENYSDLTKWRSTVFKYCWLISHFIFNMFKRWYLMC